MIDRAPHGEDDRALLDAAVKPRDGFFTTFFVSPYSKYIARWAAHRGITPNQVTVVSLAIGLLAAAAFGTGERWGLIAGAVLLQVAFTADCVDGQLARYTGNFSAVGGWMDAVFDRTKEYVVYAGLAIGGHDLWVLAAAALILQTFRHLSDFAFGDVDETGEETLAGRVVQGWAAGNRLPVMPWVRRVIAFPIGERFAAISVTAAIWAPHTTFVVLLAWGGFAAAYTTAGRVLRALARGGSLPSRFAWAVTPLLRVFEYSMIVWIATLAGQPSEPAAFALIAVLALHHYDVFYRPRFQGRPVPAWVEASALAWAGRIAVGWTLYAVDALPAGFYVLAGLFGTMFAVEAATSWRHA